MRVFAKLIDSGGSVGDDDVVVTHLRDRASILFATQAAELSSNCCGICGTFPWPAPLGQLFLAYTVMALPLPKQTEVYAVHRETTTGGVDVPPGGLPPLVTLSLPPNKYLVSAKLLLINMSIEPQQVSCTLRPMGTPGTPYDTSDVRLAHPRRRAPRCIPSCCTV